MTKSLPTLGGLWRTGSVYVVSFWFNSAMPLLLTPVLTRYLSPSDYGVAAMWQVLLSFTIPIIGLSTHGAINRRYFHKNPDPARHFAEMRDYVTSVLPILLVTALLVFIAYAILYPLIMKYLLPTSAIWILAVPAVAVATYVYNVTQSFLNAEMRAKAYAIFNNGNVFIGSFMSVSLIVGLGWNWQGRVVGAMIGMGLTATACFVYLWRRGLLGGTIRRELTLHALLFSVPLLPHILAIMVRGISDRLFLSQITNLHEIGLFSVALALAGIFGILGNAGQQAWIPWLYAHLGGQTVNRAWIVKITYVAFAVLAGLGLLFSATAPFAFKLLLGPDFEESTRFIWWLTGAAVLQGAYCFLVPYIAYVERNKYSSYISVASLAINACLNIVLIHFFGVVGVAAANFFTALYEFVAVFVVANYCMPMPWISVFYRTVPALSSAEHPSGSDS